MSSEVCGFCCEGARIIEAKYNGAPINRKLFETDNFYITVSIGAIVEGHLLVIPKQHYLSMGELPKELMEELKMIYQKLQNLLIYHYGMKVMAFEHGTGRKTDISAASVSHAHLHILPITDSLIEDIKKNDCLLRELDDFSDLSVYADSGKSYMFYIDVNQKMFCIENESLPSQFFRKLVAEKFDLGEWNWRKDYKEHNIYKTVEKLAKLREDILNSRKQLKV